ncbi:hypothetical protein WKR88_00855 [Trinickia caryophylli]|uniref:Tfp pilus assembly protein PilX n=1 Tax=Trinickia caryophylli TaxID=28094 RepID=A0A1X7CFF4_TRICW|nr:hypothetical protein [Trinickia caryophylli]WQE12857.1 hypothetical protein U0034_05510 [Trinickia caryophylli]GLU30579.1 hypothetical protein Busp01_04210 [Trinickia caryophylli]SME95494.1 hypothetical protein SAMN06295900_101306 [Trinickia caryophylli]
MRYALRYSRCTARARRNAGAAALPIVVSVAAMVLASSTASFELAIAASRRAMSVEDHLYATQSADVALALCLRALRAGGAPHLPRTARGPVRWRDPDIFAHPAAFEPRPRWPGGTRPPQCLIEGWQIDERPQATVDVVTARGFGEHEGTESWLQSIVISEHGTEKRHWRRIVARPP